MKRSGKNSGLADGAAISVSFLCLVHCLVLPLLIAVLPAAVSWLVVPESFHLAAVAIAVPASAFAIVSGHRRHGILIPGLVTAVGLLLIIVGVAAGVGELTETIITIAGSVVLSLGHLYNWRAGTETTTVSRVPETSKPRQPKLPGFHGSHPKI